MTNIEIVRAHYAASAQGNIDLMMANVSPQVRWTEMAGFPCAGTWVGPQAVVDNVFAVLGRDWTDYRFELQSLVDGGDHVVGRWGPTTALSAPRERKCRLEWPTSGSCRTGRSWPSSNSRTRCSSIKR